MLPVSTSPCTSAANSAHDSHIRPASSGIVALKRTRDRGGAPATRTRTISSILAGFGIPSIRSALPLPSEFAGSLNCFFGSIRETQIVRERLGNCKPHYANIPSHPRKSVRFGGKNNCAIAGAMKVCRIATARKSHATDNTRLPELFDRSWLSMGWRLGFGAEALVSRRERRYPATSP